MVHLWDECYIKCIVVVMVVPKVVWRWLRWHSCGVCCVKYIVVVVVLEVM